MYQQIMEQIIQRIAIGDCPPNTPLPSIRQMATEINVSLITVKRAYLEFEKLQREELTQHLEQVGKLAKSLAISQGKLLDMIKKYA